MDTMPTTISIHSTNQSIKKFNIWGYTSVCIILLPYSSTMLHNEFMYKGQQNKTNMINLLPKKCKYLTIHNLYWGVRSGPHRKK